MKPIRVALLTVLAGLIVGCARSPNGPDDQPIEEGPAGRTYTNRDLGFQVTIPKPLDTSWGMSVQTIHHTGFLADGTTLSVYITAPRGRGGFQPTFSILPFPVGRNMTLSDFVAQAVKDFSISFGNYRESAHRTVSVGGVPAERWTFTALTQGALTQGRGDRFVVVLVVNGKLGYLIQGSGIEGYYPLEDYENILKTFTFL